MIGPGELRQRARGDRGAAIFETALITPVFFLLVFGIFEFGLIFRDYLTTSDAVGDAVRRGAVQGPEPAAGTNASADYSIVSTLRQATAAIPVDWIESIVIFRADERANTPAVTQARTLCDLDGPTSAGSGCNYYQPRQAFLAVQNGNFGYFDCPGGSSACGWDPLADPNQRLDGPDPLDIDYIGVYVKIERPYVTGIFGDTFTIEHAAVAPLEPGESE